MLAAALGVVLVLAVVRAPAAGAEDCDYGLPFKALCTGYSVASDALDGVSATSKSVKNTAETADHATDGVSSATEGVAKLIEKANRGIDNLGSWWEDAKRRRATTRARELPPIVVVPIAPDAVPSAPTTSPSTTTPPRSGRSGGAIVGPNGERYDQAYRR